MSTPGKVSPTDGGWVGLVSQILYEHKSRPLASCRNEWELFDQALWGRTDDPATAEAHSTAYALCAACPELSRCDDSITTPTPVNLDLGEAS